MNTPQQDPQKRIIPSRASVLFDRLDIAFIQAESNYSIVNLMDQSRYIICKTLKECEQVLNDRQFYRCHRSYLINGDFIRSEDRLKEEGIFLKNNIQVPLSRRLKPVINKLLREKFF